MVSHFLFYLLIHHKSWELGGDLIFPVSYFISKFLSFIIYRKNARSVSVIYRVQIWRVATIIHLNLSLSSSDVSTKSFCMNSLMIWTIVEVYVLFFWMYNFLVDFLVFKNLPLIFVSLFINVVNSYCFAQIYVEGIVWLFIRYYFHQYSSFYVSLWWKAGLYNIWEV